MQSSRGKIGRILRLLRERTAQNQGCIARKAGISTSMLSQIERGATSPSIDTLIDICQALGIEPGDLFNRLSPAKNVRIYHQGERLEIQRNGIHFEQLAPSNNPAYPAELILLEVAPGAQAGVRREGHEGIEMGYVLSGRALLQAGRDRYELRAGDSLAFASSIPHTLLNQGEVPFRALWSVSPPHRNYLDTEYQ